MNGEAQPMPGVVDVRLLGEPPDCDALAAILAAHPGVDLIRQSGPRANRRDPGVRVYLTVRVKGGQP